MIDMIKVALINPLSPFLISDTVMPPLGIMYLSSYIKCNLDNVEVKIIDLPKNSKEIPNSCDIYAFTSTTPQYGITLEMMKDLKKNNMDSTFIIGGAHASCFKEKCIDDGFDYVIVNEGERSLLQVIQNYKKDIMRKIVRSENIEYLDIIPFPDRDYDNFKNYDYRLNGKKCTTMITSRGCSFNCSFCCKTWTGKVRFRSSENIIKEVEEIKRRYDIDSIMFYDDTFTLLKPRLYEICKGLNELDINWRCFIRANTVNKSVLENMYNSGCVEVGMGVESGNQHILDSINKNITVDNAINVCNWCHDIGLKIKTFLMIGLPGESHNTVDDTINFLKRATPDNFDYTIYTPFPNSELWNNKNKYDINFDENALDYSKMFYKGKKGIYMSQVSTSHLTCRDIERLRDYIDIDIRDKLYNHNHVIGE